MLHKNTHTWLYAIGAGLVLILNLPLASQAQISQPCGPPGNPCTVSGNFIITDALYGAAVQPTGSGQLTGVRQPQAGPLTYAELKQVEEKAHDLLTRNKGFRQDISPHQEATNFDDLVRNFDASGGFTAPYTCDNGGTTLQRCLENADAELRHARDMYAYLAVYGDETRFRNDGDLGCSATPLVEDPFASPPVIDRCNFAARMRESLREAAYLRMIFGQQFTVDALGFTFGANALGGDEIVQYEVQKLQQAETQFLMAREAVVEGMDHYLGHGCYVSDFYTEPEWALLSRAVDGIERARHHIAVRKSYLAPGSGGLPAAQAEAQNVFREAAMEQYLDLALTANLRTTTTACAFGTRPDNDLVATMVADLLATRENAREMQEGRNIFGFDVSFTAARPYHSSTMLALAAETEEEQALTLSGDVATASSQGLWEQAMSFAEDARTAETIAQADAREFDREGTELLENILGAKLEYDLKLEDMTGCNSYEDETTFFTCVEKADENLQTCNAMQEDNATFQDCLDDSGAGGLLRQAWDEARTAYLELKDVQTALDNITERQIIENERNAKVTSEILTNGEAQALGEFLATLYDSLSVEANLGPEMAFKGVDIAYNPLQPTIALLRREQTLRQAMADVTIENANSIAVVKNFLLDIVELQITQEIAAHKVNAQITTFNNLAASAKSLAVEARRARSYALQSPANDPSYRLVRNSSRLALADALERAARVSYLAAKRAEYEYAARLSANGVRISDIYKARTAQDIINFLDLLDYVTSNVLVENEISGQEFSLSIARHVLGLTNEELGCAPGTACPERTRLFREWVASHTQIIDEQPALVFSFATSAEDRGIFSNIFGSSYRYIWLHKVAGIADPLLTSNGFGVNIVTSQTDNLEYTQAIVTQSGTVHLKARSGCIFEYHMVHPAAMMGLEWPEDEPADVQTIVIRAGVNGQNIARTPVFSGRPVSSTNWEVRVDTKADNNYMDLGQLEDIELIFDTSYGSRSSTEPPDSTDCVRIDF